MQQSNIIEHFAAEALQQDIEQGATERALKDILEVLTLRLNRIQRLFSSLLLRQLTT